MQTKGIAKLWVQGTNSTCLVIPKKITAEHGLTDEDHVTVESVKEGILIRKINIDRASAASGKPEADVQEYR